MKLSVKLCVTYIYGPSITELNVKSKLLQYLMLRRPYIKASIINPYIKYFKKCINNLKVNTIPYLEIYITFSAII